MTEMEKVDLAELERRFSGLMEKREAINKRGASPGGGKSNLFMFSFMADYVQWCYEHRIMGLLSKIAMYGVLLCVLLAGSWGVAGTGAGKALGMEAARSRITNSYFAVLWSSRSAAGAELMPITPERFSGTIERILGDVLIVKYYDNGKQLRRLVRPANVVATDKQAFGRWARQYHLKGLLIDFYEPLGVIAGQQVWGAVLWYRRVPINVELVEQGIGYPEKNPPTAVVNQIFSQYYWHKARTGR